jgi:hypothetical protein
MNTLPTIIIGLFCFCVIRISSIAQHGYRLWYLALDLPWLALAGIFIYADRLKVWRERQNLILNLLAHGRELYGLQLIEASGGLLKRGTIYVILQRMEEAGLIESREEYSPALGLPRRLYRAK